MTKKKITKEQIDTMLFWYTVYDGNYNKVGNHVGRNRKVVRDIALKHNFVTKAHLMRDRVNEHLFGVSNPAQSRFLKMCLALMDPEAGLLEEANAYVMNKRRVSTRFRHMGDVVTVLKHVEETMVHLTGEKNIRQRTLQEISKNTSTEYKLTVANLLDELNEEDSAALRKALIQKERSKIIEGTATIT